MASGDISWSDPFIRVEHTGDIRSHRTYTGPGTASGFDEPGASPLPAAKPIGAAGYITLGHWGTGVAYSITGPGLLTTFRCRISVAVWTGSVWRYAYADGLLNGWRPTGRIRAARTTSGGTGTGGDYKWENEAAIEIEIIKVNDWENNSAIAIGALAWRSLVVD